MRYKAYLFVNKDPAIDILRTKVNDTLGSTKAQNLRKIETDGGPSLACMQGWFGGKTRRPQNATLEAAGRAIGLQRVWVPLKVAKRRKGR